MSKTACDEAADTLKNVYWLTSNQDVAEQRADLDKRLRAEARELKRLRRLIVAYADQTSLVNYNIILKEAARIQKEKRK